MKKLLLIFLLLPFLVKGQTTFLGANGSIIRNSTAATFTNTVTTDQVLFSSTIKAGGMVVDKPYVFTCDLSMTSGLVTLPAISLNVKLAGNTLTFVSAAPLVASLSGASLSITGYLVLRADGTVLVKFSPQPSSSSLSALTLSQTNTTQYAVWSGVNPAIDNAFSVNISFSTTLTSTSVIRQYYARSEF